MSVSTAEIAAALRVSAKETERLRQVNQDLLDAASEPIAIVGMSCRYPGGVASPTDLWDLVDSGASGISRFPDDRGWDLERIYDPDPETPGTSYVCEGGFLAGAGDFDPGFFGISPREALFMDPQGRLLLEASWEAIEAAGIDPHALAGSQGGLFAGVMFHDYGWGYRPAADQIGYFNTSGAGAIITGRVAYTLGLEGPTVTVDTACSSSLVSIHLAAQALRRQECSLALAGGVSVLSTPGVFLYFSEQRGLAPDGLARSFAEAANGTGVAEGVGMLVLERLSDARANGRRILAVLKGSAVNQDGASNGLTAPNGPAQERVIRQALANAQLRPAEVDAVEAHGTGTALGDPIEAGALLATYGQERDRPLWLGSIKSNIGHPQAAAGVAGVIKMVMAMQAGVLPRTLHVDRPSSRIEWDSGQVELLTRAVDWAGGGNPRRAGISSFGLGGTNAHLILEEAPATAEGNEAAAPEVPAAGLALPGPMPLVLSAKTEEALRSSARRLAAHMRARPELEPNDIAYSLNATRPSFERRAVALGSGREELLGVLDSFSGEAEAAGLLAGAGGSESPLFVFPGYGSQWRGMAVELLDASPLFAGHMEACEEALAPFIDWSPRDFLTTEDDGWLQRPAVVQPLLFATMVSLARLWQDLGVRPSAVIGHSQGEIAAAHIAGGLSLGDAARVVALRSQLMIRLTGRGGLISVALPADSLAPRLERWQGKIEVAALNGPAATIVAGDSTALDELEQELKGEGARAKRILGATAPSHCAYVEELRDEMVEVLAPISPVSGEIPFYSTVAGGLLDTAELGVEYWYRSARQPVLFAPVLRELVERGSGVAIEISPHPVLTPAVEEVIAASAEPDAVVLGTLRRGEGGPERFTRSLAEAQAAGVGVDPDALFAGSSPKAVELPTYPFQRRRYWLAQAEDAADPGAIGQADPDHPLLKAAIDAPLGGETSFTGRLSLQTHPWLGDHAAFGIVLLPGTAFVEMALAAGGRLDCGYLEELTLEAPLVFEAESRVAVQVLIGSPDDDGRRRLSIHSRAGEGPDDEWVQHASGLLSAEGPALEPMPESWPPPGAEALEVEQLYERLAELGLEYGPAFQGVEAGWQRGEETFAEIALSDEQAREAGSFLLHPALLDATAHVGFDRALAGSDDGELLMPFIWRGVSLRGGGASALRVRLSPVGGGHGIAAFDQSGEPVFAADAVVVRPVDQGRLGAAAGRASSLYRVKWEELDRDAAIEEAPTRLAYIGDGRADDDAEAYTSFAQLQGAIESGAPVPDVVLFDARRIEAWRGGGGGVLDAFHAAARLAIDLLQAWLADERLSETRLVLLTEAGVALGEGEEVDLATAPLWGIMRVARSERPERFSLLDLDTDRAPARALAAGIEEPQLALRDGKLFAPRLSPVPEAEIPAAAEPVDPDSTVLITGGTSGIGAVVARHLAEHGAGNLLLASRSGGEAPGAAELAAELEQRGCTVTIEACDVGDREQLEALLGSIPREHPLAAVIHSAGVVADGVIEGIDSEQLQRVFAPKADAAWHLHELTKGLDLKQFVMFSSAAGILGGAAQASYAAANVFLDALAIERRAQGLPAVSIAWGAWAHQSKLAGDFDSAVFANALNRIRERFAASPMSAEQGLALFDAACALNEPTAVPVPFDAAVLRDQARRGMLPSVLRGLVRMPRRGAAAGSSLATRFAAMSDKASDELVLELVRGNAAAVLGHSSAEEVDTGKAFKDLGFDSLGAVELRNRLAAATGLRLQPTIVFDHPSVKELAQHLRAELKGVSKGAASATRVVPAAQEPIAIVGMACRYPGDVASPRDLWNLVSSGTDAASAFPDDRGWDLERLYHPEPGTPGTFYAREGAFLDRVADFDPAFFGISPREALQMDPQERQLLEVSWEALEAGGLDPELLRGSETGVFAGVMYQDYGPNRGMTSSTASGRVSYTLGLEGPAISVDTACSSSLVATHLAARSLRAGECSLALAGGVAAPATPSMFVFFSQQRGLSADGRCKAFAEEADGTGVSEGVGMLLLERLSDARANGHPVLATIRGSAINQDGASNGFTAPSGPSQERVIRQALADAALAPEDVDAVEAHGTGTALGDPIEAGALIATYGQERDRPLWLGSIKSNIGHPQAAAGVAGVIKMVMAMRAGELPRTLHVDNPSAKIDWSAGRVELLGEAKPWDANGAPRRAAVSSFGASGTNAHLLLEEPGEAAAADPEADGLAADGDAEPRPHGPVPIAISAKSEPALRAQAKRLADRLRQEPELDLLDLGYSLAVTRSRFEQGAVVLAADQPQLAAALGAIADGRPAADAVLARARPGKLAYLFSGQGSQRPGMGRELYEAQPAYREALDQVLGEFEPLVDLPLRDSLFAAAGSPEAALLDRTALAQPALFATEVALFRLLESLGLEPDLLAGHSIGEIGAAHVAGAIALPDACALVAARGRLMDALPSGGAMVAIEASEEEAAEAIAGKEEALAIAAVNGPRAVVLSGDEGMLEQIQDGFRERGRRTKRLAVSHAFHSPLMEPMLEDLMAAAREVELRAPTIPIVSDVDGELLGAERASDPAYWVAHARQPVRFARAIEALAGHGVTTFLELGPGAALAAIAGECLEAGDGAAGAVAIATMRGGRPEPEALALALGHAHAAGVDLDWEAFFAPGGAKRVPLPTYPFQRSRYWLDSGGGSGDAGALGLDAAGHPLLGACLELASEDEGTLFTGRLSRSTHRWLFDHAILGQPLAPGTALLELLFEAGATVGAPVVEEVTLQAPLILPEQLGVRLQVRVSGPDGEGRRSVSVDSRPEEPGAEWTRNASGTLVAELDPAPVEALGEWPPEGAEPIDVGRIHDRLAELGVDYGPAFRGLTAAWRDGDTILAEASLASEEQLEARRFGIHPALLDSIAHAAFGEEDEELSLPVAWQGVRLQARGASTLRARIAPGSSGPDLLAYDENGAAAIAIESTSLRPVDPSQLSSAARTLYGLDWRAAGLPDGGRAPAPVAFLGAGAEGIDAVEYANLGALAEAVDAGAPAPELVLADLRGVGETAEPSAAPAVAAGEALALAQEWIAAESLAAARLVVLTEGATAAAGEAPGLAGASIWGLVRTAQSEHPGRFGLVDLDSAEQSLGQLAAALAGIAAEPQLAIRAGELLVPRLVRLAGRDGDAGPGPIDPEATVLITGGSGGFGARVARHLVVAHGVRHLLLASRGGSGAAGAKGLREELERLGAESVRIEACDVAERDRLQALIDSVSAQHPLGAVAHCAAVVDDGVIERLDPERLGRAIAPKAEAAWHLHELTRDLGLSHFILFSSVAGLLGAAGQGGYAAANACLDALAARRSEEGLPASSIAWGSVDVASNLVGEAAEQIASAVRRRFGIAPIAVERALQSFDLALGRDEPLLAVFELDAVALRARAEEGEISPLQRDLVRASERRESGPSLAQRLAGLPFEEWGQSVLELVREHAAAVLGHASVEAVEPDRAFQELGFDSLAAVELRNRLAAATGTTLSPTLVFDYPSAAAIAGYLLEQVAPDGGGGSPEHDGEESDPDDAAEQIEQIDGMDADQLIERSLALRGDEE